MKIWNGYASEHSSNLVMIGRFKQVRDAAEAKAMLDKLKDAVRRDPDAYEFELEPKAKRYSDEMWDLLQQLNFYPSPSDLTQFLLDVRVKHQGEDVRVTTDEIDVSVFLKAMIRRGARVEIYSANDYPNTKRAH